jgi:Tfp pilus assembly protein PilP
MIVDPEKNTYVLGVGDEIGNMQGKIVEIKNNGILVQERRYFENVFGEKKVETATSVLAFRE